MNLRQFVKRGLPPVVVDGIKSMKRAAAYRRYQSGHAAPFSPGYSAFRNTVIGDVLASSDLMSRFRRGEHLPAGYGIGLDERCVEYPWMIGQLTHGRGTMLDAGSTLNYEFLVDLPLMRSKALHVLTLAPERECFWQKGISYLFHDLRKLPIRNDFYDAISCLSTLEHVGCDNSSFTGNDGDRENRPGDYLDAVGELCRVLAPGGSLFITVPFGIYCHVGVQQQFDSRMLATAVEALGTSGDVIQTFYRYSATGWDIATERECSQCRYVEWTVDVWANHRVPSPVPREPDRAVAARAVVCLRMNKRGSTEPASSV